ncbi:hypothetical protein PV326_010948, partial [Microctonus aethiopoides]
CEQPVVLCSRSCDTCQRSFHPSCSLIYLSSKQANPCCLESKFASTDIKMLPNEPTHKRSMSSSSSLTSLAIDKSSSQTIQSSSLERILNSFIEQQAIFNKSMTDSMSQQTSTLKKQVNWQAEIDNKLNDIKKMAETLSEHETRINKLEHHNESLAAQVHTLSEENHQLNAAIKSLTVPREISSPKTSSDVIFSGIPQSLYNNPLTAVTKVLKSIDASHQAEDIFDIRVVNKKHEVTATMSPNQLKTSFIVVFKSPQIAEHVINKKRRHEMLTIKQVFDADINGNILVNEFLDSATHELFRLTKEMARVKKWKYIWIRQGNIFIRTQDATERFHIKTHTDLEMI